MPLIETLNRQISEFICAESDLPADEIDLHSPLGALGVGSLLGTRLIGHLEELHGLRLWPTLVFEHPSIAELASAIADIASQAQPEDAAHV